MADAIVTAHGVSESHEEEDHPGQGPFDAGSCKIAGN
jgi:hypothetical protein